MSQPCPWCEEEVTPGDDQQRMAAGAAWHMECFVRSVLGSVAHQRRRCGCYIPGSTENDPPGMTLREAARAAVEEAQFRNYANVLNMDGACPACGSKEFHPGPRGGSARNIKCAGCGQKYWYRPPFPPERIDNDDACYDLTVRQQLMERASDEPPL